MAELDIDKLTIKIESDSKSASDSIDNLTKSLQNLDNVIKPSRLNSVAEALEKVGNAKLGNFSNNIGTLANGLSKFSQVGNIDRSISATINSLGRLDKVVSNIDSGTVDNFSQSVGKISQALTPLSQLGRVNLNGSFNQLKRVSEITKELQSADLGRLSETCNTLATSLKPLSDIGKISLNGAFNQLSRLPELTSNLSKVDLGKFANQMKELSNAMTPLAEKCNKISSVFARLPNVINQVNSSMDGHTQRVRNVTREHKSAITTLYRFEQKCRALKFAFVAVAGVLGDVFEESTSYVENLNLFNVAMGESTEKAKRFAESLQGIMGIDPSEFMKYQGVFANMLNGFGVSNKNMEIMSQNLTQLAYDYSSLMNVSVEGAFDKLNSAMSGQIKGLKEYGNNVSVAMVKQTGLKYGLQGSVSSWDQNTQAIMRYITIMDNASKTDVFNDMARTIITPANQVRILEASFVQLKRAIGNVASVVVGQLIPYITAFLQIATQGINALAKLLGFKLPEIDYSGMSSGVEKVEDATEGASNNLDKANKKAKELKKQLMSFDELNIINKPSDTSSSGGSGSGAGGGVSMGDIDLPQYDFTDQLSKRADELAESVKKKFASMFEPVQLSWKTYGEPTLNSFEYKWREIGTLADSVSKSFDAVWKNGTGEKTFDNIFKIITNINVATGNYTRKLKEAWEYADNGTQIIQNMWNAFNDVLETVSDIAEQLKVFSNNVDFKPTMTSVNKLTKSFESLVKVVGNSVSSTFKNVLIPLAKWTIEKVVPTLVTSLAKAMGGLSGALKTIKPLIDVLSEMATALIKIVGNTILTGIKVLASGIEALGNNKILVSALTGAVVALTSAMMFSKAIESTSQLTNGIKNLSAMASLIRSCGLGEVIAAWGTSATTSTSMIGKLLGGLTALNSTTGILAGVSEGLSSVALATEGLSVSGGILGTVMSGLSSAFLFLASNPLVAVVGGIALATTAFVALSGSTEDTKQKHEELIKTIDSATEKLKTETDEFRRYNDEATKQVAVGQQNILIAKDYADRLMGIVDSQGMVTGSQQLAQKYVDELNDRLGTNIEIHNGVIQKWDEEKQAIYENIEALKQQALVKAYEEAYIKAVQEELTARGELSTAQEKYNNAKQAELDKFNELKKAMEEGRSTYDLRDEYIALTETTQKYKEQLNQAKDKVVEIDEAMNNYDSAVRALDGTVESATNSIVEQYGRLERDGHYTYDSLIRGLNDLGDKCDENGRRWKNLSETEKQASIEARKQLLDDLAKKASATGKTYEDMLKVAKEKGAKLTDEDKKNLQKQYDDLIQHGKLQLSEEQKQYKKLLDMFDRYGIDRDSKQGTQWKNELEKAQKEGTKQGQSYIDNLAKEMDKEASKIDNSTKKIAKTNKDNLEREKATLGLDVSKATKSIDSVNRAINGISTTKTLKLKLTTDKTTLKIGDKGFDIKMMANGGYLNKGEVFIAREAGNEMVGRIGSRSAVANNDQIVKGISGGVYNAVVNAMGGMRGTTQNAKIVVQTVLDKKVIGESVVDYNNGIVKQTGKSPLMV